MSQIPQLMAVFSYLSLLTFGGLMAAFPELKTLTVEDYHWFTFKQVIHLFSIGQISPGPNMMIAALGERVAGPLGAVAAVVAYLLPTGLIALGIGRLWTRVGQQRWAAAIQKGLAPVAVGLLLAGVISMAKGTLEEWLSAVMAGAACLLVLTTRISPITVILCGALIGVFVFRVL
jgi:chromate transporter